MVARRIRSVDRLRTTADARLRPVPEGKTVKNRMHIDVNPTETDQSNELRRLLRLGARRVDVGQNQEVSWIVLADVEDNEFCLLRRRVEPLS